VGDHPNADKLYALAVDVGEASPRSVVAGLKTNYGPDELLERRVVVLCNLKVTDFK
jgi:methionyl-tRNA synthetase